MHTHARRGLAKSPLVPRSSVINQHGDKGEGMLCFMSCLLASGCLYRTCRGEKVTAGDGMDGDINTSKER